MSAAAAPGLGYRVRQAATTTGIRGGAGSGGTGRISVVRKAGGQYFLRRKQLRNQLQLVRRLYHRQSGQAFSASMGNLDRSRQPADATTASSGAARNSVCLRQLDRARRATPLSGFVTAPNGHSFGPAAGQHHDGSGMDAVVGERQR